MLTIAFIYVIRKYILKKTNPLTIQIPVIGARFSF